MKFYDASSNHKPVGESSQDSYSRPIIEHTFMLKLKVYPDGKVFHNMFPVGDTKKIYSQAGKSKKHVEKSVEDLQEVKKIDAEEY